MSQETHVHHYEHGCGCCQRAVNHFAELAPVLDHYAEIPGSLITILQKAQECYGFLSVELMRHIAAETCHQHCHNMGLPPFTPKVGSASSRSGNI